MITQEESIEKYRRLPPEEKFLLSVEIDYVSLSELMSMSTGGYKTDLTKEEYLKGLGFLKVLINKYGDKLKCLKGPDLIEFKKREDLIDWLKEKWYAGKYEDIDYGIWFDLETEQLK